MIKTSSPHSAANQPLETAEPEVITQTLTAEESQVYVHCYFYNGAFDNLIRIWKSTVLIDRVGGHRSRLLHAENISYAPEWTRLPKNCDYRFLLIFEGLPGSCVSFDLLEDIPEEGGFFVSGILRNSTDVYHVRLSD
jgi:hypothetical protein